MINSDLQKLMDKAGEMAIRNMWGESAYKINTAILRIDNNNSAACTRLAKYYRLNDNIAEAKKMYLKALEINPNNQGVINNLNDIEKEQQEMDTIEQMKTGGELYTAGRNSIRKGQYKLALKLLLKAYKGEPLVKYALSLADAYKKLGEHERVGELHRELLIAHPSSADVNAINVGFSLLKGSKI